jgi:beta-glucanase (GH16 family)
MVSALVMSLSLGQFVPSGGSEIGIFSDDYLENFEVAEFADEPIWEQDFTSMSMDEFYQTWKPDLRPNVPYFNEKNVFGYSDSEENIRIVTGVGLIIEAILGEYTYENDENNNVLLGSSGRVNTHDTFSASSGRLEIVMKFPKGHDVWPAAWALPVREDQKNIIEQIESDGVEVAEELKSRAGGEIDFEQYGDNPDIIEGTFHTLGYSLTGKVELPDPTDEFHTYAVEFTPDYMLWLVDEEPFHLIVFPSNDPVVNPVGIVDYYFILNLAIMGDKNNMEITKDMIEDYEETPRQFIIRGIKFFPLINENSDVVE